VSTQTVMAEISTGLRQMMPDIWQSRFTFFSSSSATDTCF